MSGLPLATRWPFRLALLAAGSLAALMLIVPRVPQPEAYRDFAD